MTQEIGRVDYYQNTNTNKWVVFGRICGIIAEYDTEREAIDRMIKEIQNKLTEENMRTATTQQFFTFGEGRKATQTSTGKSRIQG